MKKLNKPFIKRNKQEQHTINERILLSKMNNPFLVKLYCCFQDQDHLYFIMEFIQGGELFFHLHRETRFDDEKTSFYIAELILALNFLHKNKIIYRDIKPENIIVLKNGYLKLIDFGTAKEIEDRTKTIIGTPHYMAPEVILGREYSFPVDFWSISICMYEFICGEVPFGEREEDPMEIYFAIINNELYFDEVSIKIDKEFKHIMKKMLDKNPSYRLSNYHSIKNQAWFKDFNWDELSNLNLKAPYIPIIPESNFDFDEQCKPKFDIGKNKFIDYLDYLKENNNILFAHLDDKLTKEQKESYMKWYNKF
jgi:cGMP-dependent protein kinase